MTPRHFLYIGGVILLALGIYGFIFPDPFDDVTLWNFSVHENYIHLFLGVIAIGVGFFASSAWRWFVTLLYGLGGIGTAVLGFALSGQEFPNLAGGANLENPVDNVIHLVVGLWALGTVVYTYRSIYGKPEMIIEEEKPEERKMRRAA